jgi:hypothetical protein
VDGDEKKGGVPSRFELKTEAGCSRHRDVRDPYRGQAFARAQLPPEGSCVSSAPRGTQDLSFGSDGRVA